MQNSTRVNKLAIHGGTSIVRHFTISVTFHGRSFEMARELELNCKRKATSRITIIITIMMTMIIIMPTLRIIKRSDGHSCGNGYVTSREFRWKLCSGNVDRAISMKRPFAFSFFVPRFRSYALLRVAVEGKKKRSEREKVGTKQKDGRSRGASRLYFCLRWFLAGEELVSTNKKVNDLSISVWLFFFFFPFPSLAEFLEGFSLPSPSPSRRRGPKGAALAPVSRAISYNGPLSSSELRNNRRRVQTSRAINIV